MRQTTPPKVPRRDAKDKLDRGGGREAKRKASQSLAEMHYEGTTPKGRGYGMTRVVSETVLCFDRFVSAFGPEIT